MKTAVIISNGSICDYQYHQKYLNECDLIICADGGAAHVRGLRVIPDILLGDLDSIKDSDYQFLKDNNIEIIKFPVEKDMTDTELAVETALDRGCRKIIMIGSTGTRLDHSLSNIFMLKSILDRGAEGIIANEHNEIYLIDRKTELKREPGLKVTLLSLTEKTEGVTTKGLYYPLTDATLSFGSSWGVSNEFSSETAEISLKKGLLLVIKSRD